MAIRKWQYAINQVFSNGNQPYKDKVTTYEVYAVFGTDAIGNQLKENALVLGQTQVHTLVEMAHRSKLAPTVSQLPYIKEMRLDDNSTWFVTVVEPFTD